MPTSQQWFVHIVQGETAKASKAHSQLQFAAPFSLTFVFLKAGNFLLASQSQTLSDIPSSKLLKQIWAQTFLSQISAGLSNVSELCECIFLGFFLHNSCCTFCVHGKKTKLSGCLPRKRGFRERIFLADKILAQTSLHCLSCLQTPSPLSRFQIERMAEITRLG